MRLAISAFRIFIPRKVLNVLDVTINLSLKKIQINTDKMNQK